MRAQLVDRQVWIADAGVDLASGQKSGEVLDVGDDEVEVLATGQIEVVHLLDQGAPHQRAGDGGEHAQLLAPEVGGGGGGVVGAHHEAAALGVVPADDDGLAFGLLFEARHFEGRRRDDVGMSACEQSELVPGGRRLDRDPGVLLELVDNALVVHVIPDGVGSEGEADDAVSGGARRRGTAQPGGAAGHARQQRAGGDQRRGGPQWPVQVVGTHEDRLAFRGL